MNASRDKKSLMCEWTTIWRKGEMVVATTSTTTQSSVGK